MVLYKYLPAQYAAPFVENGETLFRSLLYFLACEDARRDELEGTRQYAPGGGLQITNHTQGWVRQIPASSLHSSVKYRDLLFVFCTSRVLSPALAEKFNADACIEMTDPDKFFARLRGALRRNPRVKLKTLRRSAITYYDTASPPEAVWALPDEIIMHKRAEFRDEEEFRFAFGLKRHTFDFENVDLRLDTGSIPKVPMGTYPQMLVRVGNLSDCCRIHRF